MREKKLAHLNLALAMVIVGSSVVAGKLMIEELPVFLASALRFGLALILLWPLVKIREGGLPGLSRKSWVLFGLQALCGSFLFTICLLQGLKLTIPGSAGIITSTTPACMGLMGWLFLKEKPTARTLTGIALSMAGILVLNLMGPARSGPAGTESLGNALWGNLLVLAAVVFESLFLLIRKGVREPVSPLAAALFVSLFGFLFFLPVGAYQALHTDLNHVGMTAWLSVLYYAVFITVLAYLFWFAGIVRASASAAAVFTGIMPLSALALSALVLGERIGPEHLLGCGLVLAGILCLSRFRLRRRRVSPAQQR